MNSKTELIYVIQQKAGNWGWEDVFATADHKEGKDILMDYEQNDLVNLYRMVKRRVWKDTQEPYRGPDRMEEE